MKNSVFIHFSELLPNEVLMAENFVKKYEVFCTSLASLLRKKSDRLYIIIEKTSFENNKEIVEKDILGLVNLDSTIYHCIPNILELFPSDFYDFFLSQSKKKIKCISGEAVASNFLLNVLLSFCDDKLTNDSKYEVKAINNYKMMALGERKKIEFLKCEKKEILKKLNSKEGENIIRCTENEMELLSPLQREYMKTEIAIQGKNVSDAEVSIMLRQILKNQLCLAMFLDGDIVAKANTNAIGFNCIQIGGVYTHPLYRRNGYAEKLVNIICYRGVHAKKNPVLFVKEKNVSAFNLYKKIGFEECGFYEIIYF